MPKQKARYEYNPVGLDARNPHPDAPLPGTHVVLDKRNQAQRQNANYKHIADPETGTYWGAVHKDSLQRVSKAQPMINPEPVASARMNSLFNDRRGQSG